MAVPPSNLARHTTLASAAGSFLLLDSLRVWLPSFTTIYGSAGTTSAITLALFALAWVVPVVLVVPLAVSRWGRFMPMLAATVLVAARVVLQTGASGSWQLYASSLAICAGFAWLVAVAARGWSPRETAVGIAIALAATTFMALATSSLDLTWQPPAVGWPILLLAAAALLGSGWACRDHPGDGGSALWLAAMPALILAGLISIALGRSWASVEWSTAGWPGTSIGIGAALSVLLAVRGGLMRTPWLAALLVIALTALADLARHGEAFPAWIALPQALLALTIPAALAQAAHAPRRSGVRRGLAAYAGLLIGVVLLTTYYVAFDMAIPVPRPAFVLAIACVLVLATVAGRRANMTVCSRASVAATTVFALACVAAAWMAAPAPPMPATVSAQWPLKMLTYNIRYGISDGGRFNPETLAEVIGSHHPDVVMLQEVDRGFLLNGSHDVLALLQRRLHMYAYYNPASEPLFGDAILSRWPLQNVQAIALPAYDVPTRPGVLSGVLKLGSGDELVLAVSHLHEKEGGVDIRQVNDLAGYITRWSDAGRKPLVLAGDYNLEPKDARLQPILAVLNDGLAAVRPLPTWPAGAPTMQLDYFFLSQHLHVSDIDVPVTSASDHRPVVAKLTLGP